MATPSKCVLPLVHSRRMFTSIEALKREAATLPIGTSRLRTVRAKVLSINPENEEWWYSGCRLFDSERNRYCRKPVPDNGVVQAEDDGVNHVGPCKGKRLFWQFGLTLGGGVESVDVRIGNAGAYLLGRNGIPIFAQDIAHLGDECRDEVMRAVLGDIREFDIEMKVDGPNDYDISFHVWFVHYRRGGFPKSVIPKHAQNDRPNMASLSLTEHNEDPVNNAILALLLALEHVEEAKSRLEDQLSILRGLE